MTYLKISSIDIFKFKMSKLECKVTKEFNDRKIRDFLKEKMELSSRLIKKSSMEQRIFVNNTSVRMNYIIKTDDNVSVDLNRNESQDIEPENLNIEVVYEDSDILVINKRPYMVVHPTKKHLTGTLANGVMYHFKATNQNCIVRLVNRLDMNTSGLIIIGKNQFAHMSMSNYMQKNEVKKRYLAVVHGNIKEKEGTIDLPIYREIKNEIPALKRTVDKRGQRSITHYKVIESFKGGDLVECLLETGRTHQIRVHLSNLGHPIYGDFLYGDGDNEVDLIPRQALHAYNLEFKHLREDKMLNLKAELPEDIKKLIEKIK